jgi:uncharacterized protein
MDHLPIVSVRGEATILVEPELADLAISIEARAPDQQAALDLLQRRARQVAELLSRFRAGIERSETSRLNIFPVLHQKKTEQVRRYVGEATTSVVVRDFAVLSDLVVEAGALELVSVAGPRWRLREDSPAYRKARQAAVADALRRARDYAAAFGVGLTGLLQIADVGMSQPESEGRLAHFASASAARTSDQPNGGIALEPAVQRIVGQVEARFLLDSVDLSVAVPAESTPDS